MSARACARAPRAPPGTSICVYCIRMRSQPLEARPPAAAGQFSFHYITQMHTHVKRKTSCVCVRCPHIAHTNSTTYAARIRMSCYVSWVPVFTSSSQRGAMSLDLTRNAWADLRWDLRGSQRISVEIRADLSWRPHSISVQN